MKDDYKSLGGVGQNYDIQLQKQRMAEETQKNYQARFSEAVYKGQMSKLSD